MNKIIISIVGIAAISQSIASSYSLKLKIDNDNLFIKYQSEVNVQQPPDIEEPIVETCETNPELESCKPKLTAWEQFAFERNLNADWDILAWKNNNLNEIPNEPYPLSEVSGIDLSFNNLQNLDGLQNITRIRHHLDLHNNNISNINGLSSIRNIEHNLSLSNNPLSDISSLSNLERVGADFYLSNTNVNDLRPISNLTVNGYVNIDSYTGPKLNKNSNLCNKHPDKFTYNNKALICSSDWHEFAASRGISDNFHNPDWRNLNLGTIPTSTYPYASTKASILFGGNNITNISGLNGIYHVGGHLDLQTNNITDLTPLSSINSISGNLALFDNSNLKSLNGLQNIKTIGGHLYLQRVYFNSIEPLANVTISGEIHITSYTGVKLNATTPFCSLHPASKFKVAAKTAFCK